MNCSAAAERLNGFLGRVRLLNITPSTHIYGIASMVMMPLCDAESVFVTKFDEHVFLNAIQMHRVNMATLEPPLIIFLAKSPLVDHYDLSSLRVMKCGAATLKPDVINAVNKRLNLVNLSEGYGMTEALCLLNNNANHKFGSVGKLFPGVWGKIIDPDTGKTLGPNQRGELCFKGSIVMDARLPQ